MFGFNHFVSILMMLYNYVSINIYSIFVQMYEIPLVSTLHFVNHMNAKFLFE